MDGRLPRAVIDACKGDMTAMCVFAVIDAGTFKQREIAALLDVDEGTVRRALKRLRERALVHGDSRSGFVLEHVEARVSARALVRDSSDEARADARSEARADARSSRAGDQSLELIPKDQVPPTPTSSGRARAITQLVWDLREHPPATPFVGVVKIAKRFVDAGWSDEEITRAMATVPTISTGWVEAELTRQSKSSRPAQRVDTDREGTRGRIKL